MEGRSNQLFVDSNYWISLFHPNDSLHQKASAIGETLKQELCSLEISNLVFLEVVTVLSQRGGKLAGITAGKFFLEDPSIRIIHVDEHLQRESWRIFQDMPSKNMSFVDCSTLAVLRAEGIRKLLTFDTTDFKNLRKTYRFSLYE
jgi:predicted nucleic acid-binding protein